MTQALLSVRDLSVTFATGHRRVARAVVDGVSFDVGAGEVLGLVGESGSGKSVTSLAVMGLLPSRTAHVTGRAYFDGIDLLAQSARELSDRRGRDLAMVFQDAMTALNPVLTVGRQITEVLQRHRGLGRKAARHVAIEVLARVGIPDPGRRFDEFPHQLSGGMRQRVLIAAAVACHPRLLIADEPTTALDVTVQAQILELLRELIAGTGTALLMITHDLGVVAGLCDRVLVMYAGRIVETAPRYDFYANPMHPYSRGLLATVPRADQVQESLQPIPGTPAAASAWAVGCAFAARCERRSAVCSVESPPLAAQSNRAVLCHHPYGGAS